MKRKAKKPSKAKSPLRPQKRPGLAMVSSADLAKETGYSKAALSELSAVGVITPVSRGFWPAAQTMGAIIRRLRERQAGDEDRQRKNKSEADEAEIRAMDAARLTITLADAKQFWSDARIELRQTVERADYLTQIQKTKLLAEFAKLRTKQPEKE